MFSKTNYALECTTVLPDVIVGVCWITGTTAGALPPGTGLVDEGFKLALVPTEVCVGSGNSA